MLELLYAAGLRVSELVNLNLDQVNLAANELRVWGKGSKERVVLMGAPAARALNAYINQGRRELLGNKKSNALFVNRYGARLLARRVQKILLIYSRNINKKVHPHILRHTFATHLLDGGADLKVVQELLGHADLSSTQIYTHVTRSQARRIYLAAHPMAGGNGVDSAEVYPELKPKGRNHSGENNAAQREGGKRE
jgi:integrase/recombinase XerC